MNTMAGVLQGMHVAKFKVSGVDASSAIQALADAGAERVSGDAGYERRALSPEPKRSFVAKVAMLFNVGEDDSIVHRAFKSKFGHSQMEPLGECFRLLYIGRQTSITRHGR